MDGWLSERLTPKGFVGDTWWHLHSIITEGAGVGWGTRVYFFFFFFFFQKVASNPTEYREDHFKLYPQVISPVSLNKKKKLLLESNSKGTIFSYRLGGMGGGGGGIFEITWFS